jgi:isoleucyl-tRNA synthetase
MDAYDVTRAARTIQTFILDELSNWYVRRSRRRFWKGEVGPDKEAAYQTLYTVLLGALRLLAPFTPFIAEEIYLALGGRAPSDAAGDSVHLEPFPEADRSVIDAALEGQMDVALTLVSLGRTVRNDSGMKVRQPLSRMLVHSREADVLESFLGNDEIVALVTDELNVRAVEPVAEPSHYMRLHAKPNFPALGRRFGKGVPAVAEAIKALDTDALLAFNRTGRTTIDRGGEVVELGRDELTVEVSALEGFGVREERGVTVVLDLELTRELELEGAAREVVNRVQNLRKRAGFDVTDRIRLRYQGGELAAAVFEEEGELIGSETLADDIAAGATDWQHRVTLDLGGDAVTLAIAKTD